MFEKFEKFVSVEDGNTYYIALFGRWRGCRMNNGHLTYLEHLKMENKNPDDKAYLQEIIDSIYKNSEYLVKQ